MIGVSRQAVTKWERDQSAPNTENLFKLAELFDTTVDILISSNETNENQSLTERVFHLFKLEEDRKKLERLKGIKLISIIVSGVGLMLLLSAGLAFFLTQGKTILTTRIQVTIAISFFITSASLTWGCYHEKRANTK